MAKFVTTMNNSTRQSEPAFLGTREYRRFADFADACRKSRYIGLCHGYPGVGKTLSAWHYTKWHLMQPFFLIASISITDYRTMQTGLSKP